MERRDIHHDSGDISISQTLTTPELGLVVSKGGRGSATSWGEEGSFF